MLPEILQGGLLICGFTIVYYARKLIRLVENPPPIPTMDFFPQPVVKENTNLAKKEKQKSELTMFDDDGYDQHQGGDGE